MIGKYFLALLFGLLCSIRPLEGQNICFSGQVSHSGSPVKGATVKCLSQRTLTANDGRFALSQVPKGKHTLVVQTLGFEKLEIQVIYEGKAIDLGNLLLTSKANVLDEVVVTGNSRAVSIRENPVPVKSITLKTIEQTIGSNIIDALSSNAPGLSTVKTGPNVSKPFIRGLGYNRVLTLYDGMRQEGQQWGDEHGIEIDGYNISKAEVLKGPASLQYGSDALAGVVALYPGQPFGDSGKVGVKHTREFQSNNQLQGLGTKAFLNSGSVSATAAFSARNARNYQNAVDQHVYNTNFRERTASLMAGFRKNQFSSQFGLTYYDNLQAIPDGSRDSLTRIFTKQTEEAIADDINARPHCTMDELQGKSMPLIHQHIRHRRLYWKTRFKLGYGETDLLIGYQHNERKEFNHPKFPSLAGLNVSLRTWNLGVRYSRQLTKQLETTLGSNWMLQQNRNVSATDFPIPDYRLIDGGGFFFLKYKKTKWAISLGGRSDFRTTEWADFYVSQDPSTGFDQKTDNPNGANLQFPSYTALSSGASFAVGATYLATPTISLKGNIGRGYRAPNITELASNGLDPGAHIVYKGDRTFEPEFSLQEDMGLLAKNKSLDAEISFFHNQIDNYIYLSLSADEAGNPIVDPQGNKTYKYQQSKARLMGFESAFALRPSSWKGWWLEHTGALVLGSNLNPSYTNKGNLGENLPLLPPFKTTMAFGKKITMKQFSLAPKLSFDHCFAQNRYLGLFGTETKTPAYTLCDLSMSLETQLSELTVLNLYFQASNIFDEAYQSHLSRLKYFEPFSASPNGRSGIYNMGKNLSVKAIFSWRKKNKTAE